MPSFGSHKERLLHQFMLSISNACEDDLYDVEMELDLLEEQGIDLASVTVRTLLSNLGYLSDDR